MDMVDSRVYLLSIQYHTGLYTNSFFFFNQVPSLHVKSIILYSQDAAVLPEPSMLQRLPRRLPSRRLEHQHRSQQVDQILWRSGDNRKNPRGGGVNVPLSPVAPFRSPFSFILPQDRYVIGKQYARDCPYLCICMHLPSWTSIYPKGYPTLTT